MLVLPGGMLASVAVAQAPMVNGQVTKIDESAGKITLKHGPIKKLDMNEGMTMIFRVQYPVMLKRVKVGDRVRFDADRINGQFTVATIEKGQVIICERRSRTQRLVHPRRWNAFRPSVQGVVTLQQR
jgi:Cu(I)/Ag(I) efflux system protein CusF